MFRFFAFHVGFIVLLLLLIRRSLSLRGDDLSKGIRLRHYIFISFLGIMNFSGLHQATWTLRQLVGGEMITSLRENYIALRELPPGLLAAIWWYSIFGRCTSLVLALGMARSKNNYRLVFRRLFPLLVVADGVASCITGPGKDGLPFVRTRSSEFVIVFISWLVFAIPYWIVYRFYRSPSTDTLFSDVDVTTG